MTTQFKQTIFFKAMQKRETMTGINALLTAIFIPDFSICVVILNPF